jgi:SAM-dependent methyltransferase
VTDPADDLSCSCGSHALTLHRTRACLARDLARTRAWGHRLTQSDAADVYRCEDCGSLFRAPVRAAEVVDRYRDDTYGDAELIRLHGAETQTCLREREWLVAHGLRRGARILEVGCYVGGLLAVANRTGCEATGVDVGRETSDFVRSLGFDVVTGQLDADAFPARSFDAVFVMNCFEQLPDPCATVRSLRRLLHDDGSLLIRTPDADFVRAAHMPAARAIAGRAGVLGVPFVRCLSSHALDAMLRAGHFRPVASRGAGSPWMQVAARAA